jgi:hypothetical protein
MKTRLRRLTGASVLILAGCGASPDADDSAPTGSAVEEGQSKQALWQDHWWLAEKFGNVWWEEVNTPYQVSVSTDFGCVATGIGVAMNTDALGNASSVRSLELSQACDFNYSVNDGPLRFDSNRRVRGGSGAPALWCPAPANHIVYGVGIKLNRPSNRLEIQLETRYYDNATGKTLGASQLRRCVLNNGIIDAGEGKVSGDLYISPSAFPSGDSAWQVQATLGLTGLRMAVASRNLSHLSMATGPLPWALPVFRFSQAGQIPGMFCESLNEPSDWEGTWGDNYLCSNFDYGLKFLYNGRGTEAGNCTPINEPSEPSYTGWYDNWICTHIDTRFTFDLKFSNQFELEGYSCTPMDEQSDPHTWYDNYFCWRSDYQ